MPSMATGGAERVLLNLLNLIESKKYKIELVTIEKKGELWEQVPKHIEKRVLFPHPLLCKMGMLLFRKFQIDWLFKFFGKSLKGEYDVAVSFLDSIHTEFLFYNRAKIKKRVAVIHSSYKSYSNKSKFIKGDYKKVMENRYSKLDSIISVSEEGLSQFKELFGSYSDMRVIYNPIDRQDIMNKASKEIPDELDNTSFNFLAVGSLLPVKGYDLLLDACHLFKEKRNDFKVFILGSGYLKDQLQNKISENDLTDHVHLKGFISNPYKWMQNADALVMASKSEGLPTVLCEAMILGLPAIVPDVPGCREVIGNGKYGYMFERNATEMANKMKDMISDKDLYQYYKEQALERGKIFDDQKALEKYYVVFDTQN